MAKNSFRVWLFAAVIVLSQYSIVPSESKAMPEQKIVPTVTSMEDIESQLSEYLTPGSQLALFLDYDGTLAPIASHPNMTAMSPETESTLKELAKHPDVFVAVISGRGLSDIKIKVPISNITFGGNHGYEIENTDGTRSDYELPLLVRENYKLMVEEMKKLYNVDGAWVEDKKVSLTYHYRDAEATISDELISDIKGTIESYGFRSNQAKAAIEAKPPVHWHKGEAMKLLLRKNFGENWQTSVKTICAGDDTTDEDMIKVIQGIGKSFRVSANPEVQTGADFRLPSTKEVTLLLKWIKKHYN